MSTNPVEDRLIEMIDRRWGNCEGGELPEAFARLFPTPRPSPRRRIVRITHGVGRVVGIVTE